MSETDRVLIVEDDPGLGELISDRVAQLGCEPVHVHTGGDALAFLAENRVALLLLDYSLPDMTAAGLVNEAREQDRPLPPFIIVTGVGDERIAVDIMKQGARDYLVKDRNFLDSLGTVVVRVLHQANTERQLAEAQEALAHAQSLLMAALDQTPAGIVVLDLPDARPRIVSRSAEHILGATMEQMARTPILTSTEDEMPWQFYHTDGTRWQVSDLPLARTLRDGSTWQNEEMRIVRPDGSEIWILVNSAPIRDESGAVVAAIAVFPDITEHKRSEEGQRRLEKQLQQAQKLESLGVLAGGIAHDFNNLLMAILGNADLAIRTTEETAPARPNLDEIVRASRRASDLCKQMLAYSGRGRFELRALDLSEVVSEMAQMIEVSVSKKAALRYDLKAALPPVEADPAQIRQVVMSLTTNASEALGDAPGTIVVATGSMACDAAYLKGTYFDELVKPGRYAFIEVADTGCGMDHSTFARIFDPFFTTKFTGRGLGLAAVLGIVRGHKGTLKVASEPGKGTTFRILLPTRQAISEKKPLPSVPPDNEWRGGGTVLLIDDEDFVRDVGTRMLKWLGFNVLLAEDGLQGVEVFTEHKDSIDCVLLDLTMPRLGGEECFHQLRSIKKDVRVILSSGFSEQDVTKRFAGHGLAAFIQKPYQTDMLRQVLHEVLSAGAGK